jgi:hypothetical protein
MCTIPVININGNECLGLKKRREIPWLAEGSVFLVYFFVDYLKVNECYRSVC